jgi:hypothetical protein
MAVSVQILLSVQGQEEAVGEYRDNIDIMACKKQLSRFIVVGLSFEWTLSIKLLHAQNNLNDTRSHRIDPLNPGFSLAS